VIFPFAMSAPASLAVWPKITSLLGDVKYISSSTEFGPSHQQEAALVPTVKTCLVSSRSRSGTWEGQVGLRSPLISSLPKEEKSCLKKRMKTTI